MVKENLYKRAGISDLGKFYESKFVSDEVLDARYFKPLDRFDMRLARTMWVYDNVRAGSSVLDLGCGAGLLALLKRKNVFLAGLDLSLPCAAAARRNGYDVTCSARLSELPYPDASFDYVVSLDVLGHVGFEEKDRVLSEIKRVLRPGGTTMHGIESTDSTGRKTYDEMDQEELARFIAVDGHVGLEQEHEHAARFQRFFSHVAWEPRYVLCLSSEEFLKQADQYGLPFEDDFLEYLRGLSFKERRAFDMAMGYVFGKVSDLNIKLPQAGLYVLLKASDEPLGSFYNEHRDRRGLFSLGVANDEIICLDRNGAAQFDDGWYEPDVLPPVARWMSQRAHIRFQHRKVSAISFDLTTHIPDLQAQPLVLEVLVNGVLLNALSIFRYGWLEVNVAVPAELQSAGQFEMELRCNRTWQPRVASAESLDDRELSIAVCNIVVT